MADEEIHRHLRNGLESQEELRALFINGPRRLASQNTIVVIPEGGWWKSRRHLKRGKQKARYALIVTLESENQEIDVYTPIKTMIITPTRITL